MTAGCIIVGYLDGAEVCEAAGPDHACLLDEPLPAAVVDALRRPIEALVARDAADQPAPDPGPGWTTATTETATPPTNPPAQLDLWGSAA